MYYAAFNYKSSIIPLLLDSKESERKFIEGENYSLKGVECDGFNMEEKVYTIVKVVDTFHDFPLNSLIVKQISGSQDKIFTLSKNDCLSHGINYEKGLQIFPQSLPWVKVEKEKTSNLIDSPLINGRENIRSLITIKDDIQNKIYNINPYADDIEDYLDFFNDMSLFFGEINTALGRISL